MRSTPLLFLLAAHAACTPTDTGDTSDTGATDTVDTSVTDTDTDTSTPVDTDSPPDTDTDTQDTSTPDPVVPERLTANRWRMVFEDEFNGPTTPGDPCYDAVQTPPRCMSRYWSWEACPSSVHAQIADLNKCTWVVYDIYNWMDWGKPLGGRGINKLDASQVKVENGVLHLSAKPVTTITQGLVDAWPWDCGNGGTESESYLTTEDCPIVSGAIHSNPSYAPDGFEQLHGRFEVRAIIPNQTGAWPAHWLLPNGDWPTEGEIDIMEAVAHDPSDVHGSFHGGSFFGDDDGIKVRQSIGNHHDPGDPRFASGWHVYAVEWDAASLRYFVDDLMIGEIAQGRLQPGVVLNSNVPGVNVDDTWPAFPLDLPTLPFYWILNTSIVPTGGFTLPGFQALDHQIDWVRVYEPCAPDAVDAACAPRTTGSANLTDSSWMSGPKWSSAYRTLHTGDFDGDGKADLLLRTRFDAHATYLLRGDGRGGLHNEVTLTTASGMTAAHWSDAYRDAHVGDFDGDGADDILLQGRSTGDATFLLRADGSGGFHAPSNITSSFGMSATHWAASSHRIVVGDFDGDGDTDVMVLPTTSTAQALLLLADGQGGFETAKDLTTPPASQQGPCMDRSRWRADNHLPYVLDLDGDGADDLVTRASTLEVARWVRGGVGGLTCAYEVLSDPLGIPGDVWSDADHHMVHGDFDGDGRADVLLLGRSTSDESWIGYGGPSGITDAGSVLGLFGLTAADWSDARREASVGDLDGDGYDDVLLRGRGERTTLWLRGGPNGLQASVDVTKAQNLGWPQWSASPRAATLADFDGDGRDDVLLRGRTDNDKTYLIYLP